MEKWRGIDYYYKSILTERDRFNINNPWRTFYYEIYWEKHPEVPWALLANLVSRNAGYQMSDLARFLLTPNLIIPVGQYTAPEIAGLFAFLEAGNFLIFRDVFPPLEVYRYAKRFPDQSNALFGLLFDSEFDIDPFIIEYWKSFYATASTKSWSPDWVNDWSAGSEIQRHSFALIINEQNQIEDRLVNDKKNTYASILGSFDIPSIIKLISKLGLTTLCFPVATSEVNPKPQHLLIYTVGDFTSLEERIKTGRDLFVGLFGEDERSCLVQTWVKSQPRHFGTRRDYNPSDYSLSMLSLTPGGDKYSPPLEYMFGEGEFDTTYPVWPYYPGTNWQYRHIHQKPVPISSVKPVNTQASKAQIEAWLSPLEAPVKGFKICQLDELCEVTI